VFQFLTKNIRVPVTCKHLSDLSASIKGLYKLADLHG